MESTPKSLRLQIAFFGRTNSGKSTLFNRISGQDVAIVSPEPGTTTDVVEKPMELPPLGPVVLLDTAGFGDDGRLGTLRMERTRRVFSRADVAVVVTTPGVWEGAERAICDAAKEHDIPIFAVVNKCDLAPPDAAFERRLADDGVKTAVFLSGRGDGRDAILAKFKRALLEILPENFLQNPPLVRPFLSPGALAVFIVPVDVQAPRGRLILPQVEAIRDALDGDAAVAVVKETGYEALLRKLAAPPDLVVCDSQVVDFMLGKTPPEIPCTTFSILLAASKGDIGVFVEGAKTIGRLADGDRVLIAEACTHHATSDDIGRVKIPRLVGQKSGAKIAFDFFSGHDFPADLAGYKLVIQCGGCMIGKKEMLSRIETAQKYHVPITNYGVAIAYCRGVLPRVVSLFRR